MNMRVVMFIDTSIEIIIEKKKLSRRDYENIDKFLQESTKHHVQIYHTVVAKQG